MIDVEMIASNPLLPAGGTWAIRFDAGRTVTLVLGMRDHWRGWLSPYFAGLMGTRLGIPFDRIRLYYSATLPAVLQTPVPCATARHRNPNGPVARAVADMIERMCDQAIENGRSRFAELAGVGAFAVGFEPRIGRFFVVDPAQSGNILEIAATCRALSHRSAEPARKRRDDNHSIAHTFLSRWGALIIDRLPLLPRKQRSASV